MIVGILSLVIVLGVLALVARKQVRAVSIGTAGIPLEAASQAPASLARPPDPTVAGQARSIEQKARDDVAQALKEGAERSERADP